MSYVKSLNLKLRYTLTLRIDCKTVPWWFNTKFDYGSVVSNTLETRPEKHFSFDNVKTAWQFLMEYIII